MENIRVASHASFVLQSKFELQFYLTMLKFGTQWFMISMSDFEYGNMSNLKPIRSAK